MKFTLWIMVVVVSTLFLVEGKKKINSETNKDDGDFEFINEVRKKFFEVSPTPEVFFYFSIILFKFKFFLNYKIFL